MPTSLTPRGTLRPARTLALTVLVSCSGGGDPVEPPPPPPAAGQLAPVAGVSGQSARVATAVATVPLVRLLSTAQKPMAGVTVTFAVTAGGGSVTAATAQTNADGIASPGAWTLGTVAGANELTATSGTLTARITATGTPGPLAQLAIVEGGDQVGDPGAELPAPIVVQASDAHGNVVPDAVIAFTPSNGGLVQPSQGTTDVAGRASTRWTLGAGEGAQSLGATSGEVSGTASARAESAILLAAQVAVGHSFHCARAAAGELLCWGTNQSGVLGDGTREFRPRPVPSALPRSAIAHVSLGGQGGCALDESGAAFCWGSATTLGDGFATASSPTPVAVAGGHRFAGLEVGMTTACATDTEGRAWCWGNGGGELHTLRTTPTAVPDTLRFTSIVALKDYKPTFLGDYNCGITTDGPTVCWGIRGIGDPSQVPVSAVDGPHVLATDVQFVSLAAGRQHACGLTADGQAHCWGRNDYGQLGTGAVGGSSANPVAVLGGLRFTQLSGGGWHSCGLTDEGVAYCWGYEGGGALGTGSSRERSQTQPQRVATELRFRSIAAGGVGTCAVTLSSEVHCWGVRSTGGETGSAIDPLPVPVRRR